ncbi:ribonucleotide-diphosphate reductase small chain [Pandoravirus inopinatum]|uniref:ribonucleoside-diphosphate reductase n=1 Tax=Pandoravirus inopinatum TaxID=1605721 RepID=A0A0B5J2Y3_9VIRU|nr:ribonucleotide-diphosphate reductase small chain [Pandoravirus inopinatum]AJF97949.1 ribonucleotide-diphosphate reductase small chain [Pandoravirus inopinatum]
MAMATTMTTTGGDLQQHQQQHGSNYKETQVTMAESAPFDVSCEPLLRDNPNRFVLFPIRYQRIWEMYQKGRGLLLDRRGGRPRRRHGPLGVAERRRAPFHQARPRLFSPPAMASWPRTWPAAL